MDKFFIPVIICLCFVPFCLWGQTSAPKHSNEFLSIGVGARGLAMSGSQVANVSDVTAAFWNPAGLMEVEDTYQFSLMHAEYFAGIANYDYAGFTTALDSNNHIGITVIRFAVDDIPDTRFLYDANGRINYDNIRFFSAADYAFLFSYARRVNFIRGLKLGANFKIVHRIVGDFANAWGFGLDAGARLDVNRWQFGVLFKDVTTTFNVWTHAPDLLTEVYQKTGNALPESSIEVTLPKVILGVARYFPVKDFGILGSVDLDLTFDGKRNVPFKSDFASVDPHAGLEIDYLKTVFLRMGIGNIQQVKDFDGSTYGSFQPDFGVGIQIRQVTIDYALTDIGNQSASLYSHVFSLKAGLVSEK